MSAALVVGAAALAWTVAKDRDDDGLAAPSTTASSAPEDPSAIAARELTLALGTGLLQPLEATEAACLATGLLTGLGGEALLALADHPDPAAALTEQQQAQVVQAVVDCVPEDVAEALLRAGASTTAPPALPDLEG